MGAWKEGEAALAYLVPFLFVEHRLCSLCVGEGMTCGVQEIGEVRYVKIVGCSICESNVSFGARCYISFMEDLGEWVARIHGDVVGIAYCAWSFSVKKHLLSQL